MNGPRRPTASAWRVVRNKLANLVLIVLAVLMVIPIYWVFVTAVLPRDKAFNLPPEWFPSRVTFGNFSRASHLIPLRRQFLNSVEISLLVMLGGLTTSILAAYAFSRLDFKFKNAIFLFFLTGLMVPPQITVIPVFTLMRNLHLVNHKASVFLPGMASALGIFLLRQYFDTIPRDLDQAARIDGAGHLAIIRHIVVPLSLPSIAALSIFLFQASWNDFFWPSIFLQSANNMTLPVGLASLQGAQGESDSTVTFATITLIVAPLLVLFFFFQRSLMQSISQTGVKG
jgi:multiple sugar transport system permease protein